MLIRSVIHVHTHTTGLNGTLVDCGSRLTDLISVRVAKTRYSGTGSHFEPPSVIPVAQSHLNRDLV